MATVRRVPSGTESGQWIGQGAIGGVIAGRIVAIFEMVAAAVMVGADALFMPLRMIGGIILGARALEPTYPLATAAVVGILVHMVLSAIFGAVSSAVAGAMPALRRSAGMLIGAATVYGLAPWLVNFYGSVPLFGRRWSPDDTNAVVQVLAHAVFFGSALGLYLSKMEPSSWSRDTS